MWQVAPISRGQVSLQDANELLNLTSFIQTSPGRAQVHAGDNNQLNESSSVMAEAYKKEQQSMKHTKLTWIIHTDNMQEFELIYYFCSMKDGGIRWWSERFLYYIMYMLI